MFVSNTTGLLDKYNSSVRGTAMFAKLRLSSRRLIPIGNILVEEVRLKSSWPGDKFPFEVKRFRRAVCANRHAFVCATYQSSAIPYVFHRISCSVPVRNAFKTRTKRSTIAQLFHERSDRRANMTVGGLRRVRNQFQGNRFGTSFLRFFGPPREPCSAGIRE